MTTLDLESIYRRTLEACAPERLVARVMRPDMPRSVIAIGKCAGALLDGIGSFEHAFVAIPEGYREAQWRTAALGRPDSGGPLSSIEIHKGGHPQITDDSLAAGRAVLD